MEFYSVLLIPLNELYSIRIGIDNVFYYNIYTQIIEIIKLR